MALVYQTGSVVGPNDFYDAFNTFRAAAGWSLAETVGARDLIIKSNGTDGKANMVFRVSLSTTAANPFKDNANITKRIPHLLIQGYGAWTVGSPGIGLKPYGQVGPWAVGSPISGSVLTFDSIRIHRYNGTFPLVNPADTDHLGRTRKAKINDSFENPAHVFDGRRKLIGPNQATGSTTQIGWSDLLHGEANFSSGGIPPQILTSSGNLGCLVHDPVLDKDYYFILNPTATLAQQWLRYDFETNTWSTMAAPIWTASTTTASACVFDGVDTIYALHGNTTTEFAKYSISGNSWTNLTAAPVARNTAFTPGSSGCSTNMIYVPNSVTGIGQDVIYVLLANSGTVIYRYDVTSNAWQSTSGTGALTAPQTIGSSSFLFWDGIKNVYFATPNAAPATWYTADLSVAPNTWTSMGSVQNSVRPYSGIVAVNHIPCKVRTHATANTKYWFLGDADSITIVVKIETPTPHYYWCHFGRYSSSNRTEIMTATAPISPGGRVTIAVDSSAAYRAGESIIVWNPDTGAAERTNIYDKPNGTSIRANISGSYPTGARLGLDPTQWCAVGNGFALAPLDCMSSVLPSNETAQYVAEPTIDAAGTDASSPGDRGLFQPVPITLFNRQTDASVQKKENRCFLKNVFATSTGPAPRAQPEDPILVGDKTYLAFPDTETSRYTTDTRGIMIGPID